MTEVPEHPYIVVQRVTHVSVRRDLKRLAVALDPAHSPPPADVVSNFWSIFAGAVHHHHESEDETYWPIMLERRPEIGALVDRTMGQHQTVAAAMDAFEKAIENWRQGGDLAPAREAFQQVDEGLLEHLKAEETDVWPLIAEIITGEDVARLQSQGNFTQLPENLLPWPLESAPPMIQSMFSMVFPPDVRERLETKWIPEWQETVRAMEAVA